MSETTMNKPYTLRALTAEDIFPMINIVRKIGLHEIKNILNEETVNKIVGNVVGMVSKQRSTADENGDDNTNSMAAIGVSVLPTLLDVADIVLGNVSKCETDLYKFLASLSGLAVDDIKKLSLADFAEMILDVVQKDDFKDFFKVVSKRFK